MTKLVSAIEPVKAGEPFKGALQPIERVSEILFGLIMVLTFTGSLSVADAGRDDVRLMLIGALGCNIAWGIIDGILLLMGNLAEKSRNLMTYQALRRANPEHGRDLLEEAVPPLLASVLSAEELESLRERLVQLPEPPARARLGREDWLGALGTFVLVFLSTFPVTIPFMVMHEVGPAMRVSNGIAVILLFLAGYAFGRITGRHPAGTGIVMVGAGLVIVAMTIALGG
ncbi:MAG: VIT1/CCC1 transporter family protein [Pseudomonadales bacterium]